jgi:hypothetical protein
MGSVLLGDITTYAGDPVLIPSSRVAGMVVTRTFSDGRTDDRTMPAGASVT